MAFQEEALDLTLIFEGSGRKEEHFKCRDHSFCGGGTAHPSADGS